MTSQKGIHPLHYGVAFPHNIIAPPSQFAFAAIGVMNYWKIKDAIEDIKISYQNNYVSQKDTPTLFEFLKKGEFNINVLRKLAKHKFGSQKIITKEAVLPINKKGQLATVSKNNLATLLIESRRLRTEQKPSRVKIYHPENPNRIDFRGGTEIADFVLERGHHWSEGQENERLYLESLEPHQRRQFERSFEVIEYGRACALTGLKESLKKGRGLVGGSKENRLHHLLDLFSFIPEWNLAIPGRTYGMQFAMEAFLLKTVEDMNLNEIDKRLLGHREISTYWLSAAYKKGDVTVGALISEKNFEGYAWAVIQAIEKHYFSQNRTFNGYSIEFQDDPKYTTTSIVFDDASEDVSMRIILDDNFGLPYILYKDYRKFMNEVKLINDKPTAMINLPKDKALWKKGWISYDWRTGKECLSVIREPNRVILEEAEKISKQSASGTSAYSLEKKYKNNFFKLKNS